MLCFWYHPLLTVHQLEPRHCMKGESRREAAGLLSEATQEGLCLISHEPHVSLGGEDTVPASSSAEGNQDPALGWRTRARTEFLAAASAGGKPVSH